MVHSTFGDHQQDGSGHRRQQHYGLALRIPPVVRSRELFVTCQRGRTRVFQALTTRLTGAACVLANVGQSEDLDSRRTVLTKGHQHSRGPKEHRRPSKGSRRDGQALQCVWN